jgi:hypothetical protein
MFSAFSFKGVIFRLPDGGSSHFVKTVVCPGDNMERIDATLGIWAKFRHTISDPSRSVSRNILDFRSLFFRQFLEKPG